MNWLEFVMAIPTIIAMVVELVKKVEVPGVPGATKKQAVMDVLKASLDALVQCGIKAPGTVILTVADYVIDAVVAAYNIVGIFKHEQKAA